MASLSWDGPRARVQFILGERRHALRLGDVPKKVAEEVRLRVGELADARRFGTEPGPAALAWLDKLDDGFHDKVASFGLTKARTKSAAISTFVESYIADRADISTGTRASMTTTANRIAEYFNSDTLASVLPDAALEFRKYLADNYAPATVARDVKRCRQFWSAAIKAGFATANPFDEVPVGPESNPDRQEFIDRGRIARIMAATQNPRWHALIGLSRFGGLRCPSEVMGLRWPDVDFQRLRFTVRAHKTGERVVPLFPELRAILERVPRTSEYVVERVKSPHTHFRGRMFELIKRAGLTPWPRLWHNLRASRETELAAEYPLAVVAVWMGHGAMVAAKHYLMMREADYHKAAHNPTQTVPADAAAA